MSASVVPQSNVTTPSNESQRPNEIKLREITVAHSPDSDDAFMFYGLATNKVRVPGLKFVHTLTDIETLNRKAMDEAFYDITAISFHAYPYLQDRYALLPSGGSVGEGYGPMIVSSRPSTLDEIKTKIAIPGTLTTAYLTLKLMAPHIETEIVPFDQIIPAILKGQFEAGLIIHEGQLTYNKSGLHKIVDLGQWWREKTNLPLPLGGNVIRRDLGPELMSTCSRAIKDSIQYGLDHREEALDYAMQFARDLDHSLANRFVGMYVNERTVDYGSDGREAIEKLLTMGYDAGIIERKPVLDWVE